MKTQKNNGFSLIELLAVTAIISILAGMIGVSAHIARQSSYQAIAKTETQQIAMAFKAYRIATGEWPSGFTDGGSDGVDLSEEKLAASGLLGDKTMGNPNGIVYLDLPSDRFETAANTTKKCFLDPWGAPYKVKLTEGTETETQTYQVIVRFVNSDKYYYQDL